MLPYEYSDKASYARLDRVKQSFVILDIWPL